MSTNSPLVSASGIWYAYFPEQTQPGDSAPHPVELTGPEAFGNDSLFENVDSGVALTHRAVVNVDLHAECKHEIVVERTLAVQFDKAGTLAERGQSFFVSGKGNSAYQGILEAGNALRAVVSAPGDSVEILSGYISVHAQPI